LGFTLIELLVAMLVAMILIGALYVALDIQLSHSQAGRDVVQVKTLANAILSKLDSDISNSMGAYDQRGVPDPSKLQTDNTQPAAATGTTGTTGAAATTTTDPNAETVPLTTFAAQGTGKGTFNVGVLGSSTMLTLTVSHLKRDANMIDGITVPPGISDLHRVTYWYGGDSVGLCRQEIDVVTSVENTDVPPDVGNPMDYQFASEVASIEFQYFDGLLWQSEWDGTLLGGSDGMTPVGPPAAIKITLSLKQTNLSASATDNSEPPPMVVTHVVAIPGGNNFPGTQEQLNQ